MPLAISMNDKSDIDRRIKSKILQFMIAIRLTLAGAPLTNQHSSRKVSNYIPPAFARAGYDPKSQPDYCYLPNPPP